MALNMTPHIDCYWVDNVGMNFFVVSCIPQGAVLDLNGGSPQGPTLSNRTTEGSRAGMPPTDCNAKLLNCWRLYHFGIPPRSYEIRSNDIYMACSIYIGAHSRNISYDLYIIIYELTD